MESPLIACVGVFKRRLLAIICFAFLCTGCEIPAQIVWSPDGTNAAYRSGSNAWLVNEQGTVLRPLGNSAGGFVWSADSKSLYYAAVDEAMEPPTPQDRHWLINSVPSAHSPTTQYSTTQPALAPLPPSPAVPVQEPGNTVAISVLHDGKADALFRLAGETVFHLQLSPDGQWLAAISNVNKSGDGNGPDENHLYVFSMRSSKLYFVSRYCGLGACFIGAGRLAFVEPNGVDVAGQFVGRIVEAKLDDNSPRLERAPLLDVVVPTTRWMEACEGGLLFTAKPIAYPARPAADADDAGFKLYHYSLADHSLITLADDVGELFDQSPDGKRVLFEKFTAAATMPAPTTNPIAAAVAPNLKASLFVMNSNGSNPNELRALDGYDGTPKLPMWPAWRGNDQITFIGQPDTAQTVRVDDKERKVYDVIQYRLTDKCELEQLQGLSGDWANELKPYTQMVSKVDVK